MKELPKWFWAWSIGLLLIASLPYLFAAAIQPQNTLYLGVHSNYDDHAVYAAWTEQARKGSFFFENKFTTDAQPGKTIQLYFLAAGWVAKFAGVPLALHLFRLIFGFLALLGLYRLVERGLAPEYRLPAFLVSLFTMGIGFAFWRNYGFDGPVDVWQPELFVLPSLMQNGLFCAAIWLITVVWHSILESENSWKPVITGSVALLVLTNIHTYDTLQIAIVAAGFLAAMASAKKFKLTWLLRCLVIALGALPAVGWFAYVRSIDAVFAARADTVTISASFPMVLAGVFPAIVIAFFGLTKHGSRIGVGLASALFVLLALLQSTGYRMDTLWVGTPIWLALAAGGIAACYFYKPQSPVYGLIFAWIVMGFIAIYYPGLFQRKLAMALAVPVGIAAASGLIALPRMKPATIWGIAVILCATNVLWLTREMAMATKNISNTTMQHVFWPREITEFLKYFQRSSAPKDAVIAMPGIAVPDDFENPREYAIAIPDLNPVLSGWGGVKTYIGHWSETPDYLAKRKRVMNDLFSPNATQELVYLLMQDSGASYIVAPISEIATQAGVPKRDFYTGLGEVVYEGDEFILVRYRPSP